MLAALHVVSPMPPGETGGADEHVADLVDCQRRAGRVLPVVLELGAKGYAERMARIGVATITEPRPRSAAATRTLRDVAARFGVAVVHSHGYEADYVTVLARLRYGDAGRAFTATVHGLIDRPLRNRLKTDVNTACFALLDGVIVTASCDLGRRWPTARGRRFFVPNGIALPPPDRGARARVRRELGLSPQTRLVGYCGRLSPEKRPDLFVRTCAELRRRSDAVRFVVVGSGDELARLRSLAASCGVGDAVFFLGYRPDAPAVVSAFDVLLCPSDREGTPRAVLEAMARGVPVVATRVGGLPDIVSDRDNGRLVPRGRLDALADATAELLDDDAGRARLAARAARTVRESFTSAEMAARVEQVYRVLLGPDGRRRRRLPYRRT